MRRFLASAWFPFLTCLVLAGVTAAAFAMLHPTGDDVGNSKIVEICRTAGWAVGPVMGLLSFFGICILNLVRRVIGVRRVGLFHPVVVLAGTAPWLVFSWVLLDEPRFTPIARAIIDFAARPMLWGSLVSTAFVLLLSIPLLFPSKQQ